MQIKIGNKIRELRRHNGKRQEDLANALGVTCQAVSRWESNSGYPDMEMVPSIANYFHVTIDELFGYNGDREEKIEKILKEADRCIGSGEDLTLCIDALRNAAEEFPDEYRIPMNLGMALHLHGWRMHGLKGQIKDDSDYSAINTEHAAQNLYWQEAMRVFEKVLRMKDNFPGRDAVILIMVADYSKMGEFEKAKKLAENQQSLIVSRETLLIHATEDEEREKYLGEAIIAFMNELANHIVTAVSIKKPLAKSEISVQKMLSMAHFYEEIFDDGRMGKAHLTMRDLYLYCSFFEASIGDIEKAMQYFDKGFEHHRAYASFCGANEYRYTSPLVSKVVMNSNCFPFALLDGLKDNLKSAPENLRSEILKSPKYSECFEYLK